MVTQVLDIKFSGVIMDSGLMGTGGVNRGRGRGPDPVQNSKGKLGNVKMSEFAGNNFRKQI